MIIQSRPHVVWQGGNRRYGNTDVELIRSAELAGISKPRLRRRDDAARRQITVFRTSRTTVKPWASPWLRCLRCHGTGNRGRGTDEPAGAITNSRINEDRRRSLFQGKDPGRRRTRMTKGEHRNKDDAQDKLRGRIYNPKSAN